MVHSQQTGATILPEQRGQVSSRSHQPSQGYTHLPNNGRLQETSESKSHSVPRIVLLGCIWGAAPL